LRHPIFEEPKKRHDKFWLETSGGTPEQFGDYIRGEIAKITKIAKSAGVKAE
jgi:hypothetical protein